MAAWWNKIIPTKNEREVRRYSDRVAEINALEPKMQALPDSGFVLETQRLREVFQANFAAIADPAESFPKDSKDYIKAHRQRISKSLDSLLPEAFALVREAAVRTLKMRHYDVQLIGAMVLHDGRIAEMKTGEGKTLVATMPVYLNALTGLGVHLVTVNEYLASRDAAWMGQVYTFLGLRVGVISHDLNDEQRQQAYLADITYGTNSEFGFDYLRDNMKLFLQEYTQRGHYFSIVDEVDSILIDEARTPLIISGPAEQSTDKYIRINALIPGLRREQDYSVDEKARSVLLTEAGVQSVEQRLGIDNLYAADSIEFLHHVNQALRAHALSIKHQSFVNG